MAADARRQPNADVQVGIALLVEVQGARVEVQRDPIRLTFTNDAGELRQGQGAGHTFSV